MVAVGPGRRAANGDLIEPGVKEGDHVLMPDYGGQEVDLDGTKCAAYSATNLAIPSFHLPAEASQQRI